MPHPEHSIAAVVLAAGEGSRLAEAFPQTPKALVELGDTPLIEYVVDTLEKSGVETIVVVVGYKREQVKTYLGNRADYAHQTVLDGTGGAIDVGFKHLEEQGQVPDTLLVMLSDHGYGFTAKDVEDLVKYHKDEGNAITLVGFELADPGSLGRIITDDQGHVVEIVEARDATKKQREIKLVNSGTMVFDGRFLRQLLDRLEEHEVKPGKSERYATDMIALAIKLGLAVGVYSQVRPFPGINTLEDLKQAREWLQAKI